MVSRVKIKNIKQSTNKYTKYVIKRKLNIRAVESEKPFDLSSLMLKEIVILMLPKYLVSSTFLYLYQSKYLVSLSLITKL